MKRSAKSLLNLFVIPTAVYSCCTFAFADKTGIISECANVATPEARAVRAPEGFIALHFPGQNLGEESDPRIDEICQKIYGTKMYELGLGDCKIGRKEGLLLKLVEAIERNPHKSFLQYIFLNDNEIVNNDDNVEALKRLLTACPNLKILSLAGNKLGDAGMCFLEGIPEDHNLEELNLTKCQITACNELAQGLLKLPRLRRLFLGSNAIGDMGLLTLYPTLTKIDLILLNLSNNSIGAKGAIALACLLANPKIPGELVLDNNSIGHAGAQAISEALSSQDTSLEYLYMEGCHLEKPDVEYILGSLASNRYLQEISLAQNEISDANSLLDLFARNTTLQWVVLDDECGVPNPAEKRIWLRSRK